MNEIDDIIKRINNEGIEKLLQEIKELENEHDELRNSLVDIKDDKEKKYAISWKLKETSEKIKRKYTFVERDSENDYSQPINDNLCREIYYFEKCLSMLIKKLGIFRIDSRHFLTCAILEYEYFFVKDLEYPPEYVDIEVRSYLDLEPKSCLILQNLEHAQYSFMNLVNNTENEKNDTNKIENDLFLYSEVLGDLIIQKREFLKIFYAETSEPLKNALDLAYYYYKRSIEYKTIVERNNPNTGFVGLRGFTYFQTFYVFYENLQGDLHNVRKKANFLENKYPSLKKFNHSKYSTEMKTLKEKGLEYHNKKEHEKAIECLEKYIDLNPVDQTILIKIGEIYKNLEKQEDAFRYFKDAIKLDALKIDGLINLGEYYKDKDDEKSIHYFEKIIEIEPKNVDILLKLGEIHMCNKQNKEALQCFEKIITLNSKNVEAWINSCQVHLNSGEFNKVSECLEKTRKLTPRDQSLKNAIVEITKLLKARNDIKELFHKQTFKEISFKRMASRTGVEEEYLIDLTETMIDNDDIKASIERDYLIFKYEKKENLREETISKKIQIPLPFRAYQGEEPYIFVSYSHEDSALVYPQIKWMHDEGFNIWYDEGIPLTKDWREEIEKAIVRCQLFIVFVSKNAVNSENVRDEINLARDEKKRVLGIFLESTKLKRGLKLAMKRFQLIEKFKEDDSRYKEKVLETLNLIFHDK